ncbi:MAG: NADPH-dependent FMN reductase, partial [Sphingobacterium sp.]
MTNKQIGIFIGSLRKESYNRKIANYLISIAPTNYSFSIVEIGDLPLYNEDYDHGNPPSSYTKIREEVALLDAVLFITPEYN